MHVMYVRMYDCVVACVVLSVGNCVYYLYLSTYVFICTLYLLGISKDEPCNVWMVCMCA